MARKPGSAQIVLTGHQLILQNMFTDRGAFILVYLRPSSVNEGWQADAHTYTHTLGVGRQRKRCCIEPEGDASHLRTIKCCRMKSQKKKVRPKGKKKKKNSISDCTIALRRIERNYHGDGRAENLLPAVGMVGKR
ncbi:hypothetical protein CDAR_425151 [Caerostris darwini]|uniref:Uncharacterized protein n=1 Tax=Caerostris darwini TaxID=1538125 RepID=A0AAV4XA80_9ARAC|nr:hypothetical protein CDAR_425151 [Caerostris darwini]